jgi:hypothetical protein
VIGTREPFPISCVRLRATGTCTTIDDHMTTMKIEVERVLSPVPVFVDLTKKVLYLKLKT